MSILKFGPGRPTASGQNVAYITRERACVDISTVQIPGIESRADAIAYAETAEDDELSRPRRGRGETRTHYRAVLSWPSQEDITVARELAHRFLQQIFPTARAIVTIHNDTPHTHAHIWIAARDINNRKIQIGSKIYRNLDLAWARLFDQQYGTLYAAEYAAKKSETLVARCERRAKPARARNQMSNTQWREKDRRDAGYDQIGVNGNQPITTTGDRTAKTGEQIISRCAGAAAAAVRAANQLHHAIPQLDTDDHEQYTHIRRLQR